MNLGGRDRGPQQTRGRRGAQGLRHALKWEKGRGVNTAKGVQNKAYKRANTNSQNMVYLVTSVVFSSSLLIFWISLNSHFFFTQFKIVGFFTMACLMERKAVCASNIRDKDSQELDISD